jgi:hypothetical protein
VHIERKETIMQYGDGVDNENSTAVRAHRATVQAAEGARQIAVAAASTQAAANAAHVTFYRAARASALANGVQPNVYVTALRELGTGGI